MLVNRVLSLDHLAPSGPAAPLPSSKRGVTSATAKWPATLSRKLVQCTHELESLAEAQRAVSESLREGMARIDALPPCWLELPALFPAPTSLAGVLALAAALRRDGTRSTSAA